MSEAVTMQSLMMMMSILSEESLARDRHTDGHTDTRTDTRTDTDIDRHSHRQTDRQTDRQTNTNTHRHTHTDSESYVCVQIDKVACNASLTRTCN